MLFLGIGALISVPIFKTFTNLPPYVGMLAGVGVLWVISELIHPELDDAVKKNYTAAGALSRIDVPSVLFFLGILMDRKKPNRVIAVASLLAGFFLFAIGWFAGQPVLLAGALFCAGVCIPGAQVGSSAYAATWYPTRVRATGISWMSGMGRMGSLIGSVGGGVLVSMGLGIGGILGLLAIPMTVVAAAMAFHERISYKD